MLKNLKINEAYINILNKTIKKCQDLKEEEEDMTEEEISHYKLSKSDLNKYKDHLVYREFFKKYNFHDEFYENIVIRSFKLFFNINYKEISNDTTLSPSEIYVILVNMWNDLSRIQKRKYRGMVNTIDLYAKFSDIEQLKSILNN